MKLPRKAGIPRHLLPKVRDQGELAGASVAFAAAYQLEHLKLKAVALGFTLSPTQAQVLDAKSLLDRNAKLLGFVTRGAFFEAAIRHELLVAWDEQGVVGFIHFHLRQDDKIVIYEIAVEEKLRGRRIGWQLINNLGAWGIYRRASAIRLKCTEENDVANKFYERIGFKLMGIEPGKKRRLKVWELRLRKHGFQP